MSLKGPALGAHLEGLGYRVFVGGPRSFFVALPDQGKRIAHFDVCDDDHSYRYGWVEMPRSAGRIDCLDWIEFVTELQENHRS